MFGVTPAGPGAALCETSAVFAVPTGRIFLAARLTGNVALYGRSGWRETHRALRQVYMRKQVQAVPGSG